MLHQSFRYCLGRQSYAVGKCVDWIVENWDLIPNRDKELITREVDEAFAAYDRGQTHILGMEMDKKQWQRIRALPYHATPTKDIEFDRLFQEGIYTRDIY